MHPKYASSPLVLEPVSDVPLTMDDARLAAAARTAGLLLEQAFALPFEDRDP